MKRRYAVHWRQMKGKPLLSGSALEAICEFKPYLKFPVRRLSEDEQNRWIVEVVETGELVHLMARGSKGLVCYEYLED